MERKLLKPKQVLWRESLDFLGSNELLEQIEKSVSSLQNALFQFKKTQKELKALSEDFESASFETLHQNMLRRLKTTHFEGDMLLDGRFQLLAKGQVCRAVKIPLHMRHGQTIRVQTVKAPIPSVLYGSVPLTQKLLRNETYVGFYEGGKTAVYCLAPDETIESFLLGAQRMIFQKGLSLDLTINQEGFLKIQHLSKSQVLFFGYSEKTALISVAPGIMQTSKVGKLGSAKINGMHALWEGNQMTDHETHILWYGGFSGEELLTIQDGTKRLIGNLEHQDEPLSMQIPSLNPCDLGGVLSDGQWYNMLQLPSLPEIQAQKLCQHMLRQMNNDIQQMEESIKTLQMTGFMLLAGSKPQKTSIGEENRVQNEQAMLSILSNASDTPAQI